MHPALASTPFAIACLIVSLFTMTPGRAAAQDSAEAVQPFLDEQTVAVVGIKTGTLQAETLRPLIVPMLPRQGHFATRLIERAAALDAALRRAEVDEIYVVISFADDFVDMPFVVVPKTDDVDAAAISELLGPWQNRVFQSAKIRGAAVFGSAAALQRLRDLDPSAPAEFAAARQAAGNADAWGVAMASADHRRAVESMQPELPGAVGGGDTRTLTRGARWMTLAVEIPPDAAVRLIVQSSDAAAAAELQRLTERVLETLRRGPRLAQLWPEFAKHADELLPTVEGDQLRLTFDPSDAALQRLTDVMSRPVQQMLIEQARRQANNDLKLLALAMHNYHSTHGHFPPAGTSDPQGRPLLSWRVLLLPYLDHEELYEQFHLDEPWDSEHNRALIPRMPDVFWMPLSRHVPSDGLAHYRVPGGEQTIFPPTGEIGFRDIRDGTSNTIMIVEVDDEHADVWTKPGAHPIDLQQPALGLGGHVDDLFLYARGDGSVNAAPLSMPLETLRAAFTRDGGESVSF